MSDRNVERAGKLDTATLSDALDKLGIAGQCLGLKPLDHRFRLVGRAFTLAYAPVGDPPGTVGDFVDDVPDAVAVSEALHLVRDLSTDESPAFVNGVLGNIVRDRDSLVG